MGKSVLMRLSRSLRSSQETARWTRSRLLADEMNYYRARTNAVLRAVQLDKVELENGSEAMRKVVCHPGGVSAAILTDKNEILFGRQIRYPYAQAVEMAEKNEIFDAKTQVLILRAVRLVERGEL